MKTFNLKECIKEYPHWNTFKFEVVYSKAGVARIYVGERKTKYSTGGCGYDKESAVIAKMINDIVVDKYKYNKNCYGTDGVTLSQGGVGFNSIKTAFESVKGNKLEKIYLGKASDVYEITFSNLKNF